ncbi:hypothetical protein D3C75_549090 [compost metagenome]
MGGLLVDVEGRHRLQREQGAVGHAAGDQLVGAGGRLLQRHIAQALGQIVHDPAADPQLHALEVGGAADAVLAVVDMARPVGEEPQQLGVLVLAGGAQVLVVDPPVGHRSGFGAVTAERELDHLVEAEAARRVTMGAIGDVGLPLGRDVVMDTRMPQRRWQHHHLHATLGHLLHALGPGLHHIPDQGMPRGQPRRHGQPGFRLHTRSQEGHRRHYRYTPDLFHCYCLASCFEFRPNEGSGRAMNHSNL